MRTPILLPEFTCGEAMDIAAVSFFSMCSTLPNLRCFAEYFTRNISQRRGVGCLLVPELDNLVFCKL